MSNNAWNILAGAPSAAGTATAGPNTTLRQQQSGELYFGDSNSALSPAGTLGLSWSMPSAAHWLANYFSIAPLTNTPPTIITTGYAYDLNGNLTSATTTATTTTYSYDYANHIAQSSVGGTVTNYGYDTQGSRVFQTTGNVTTVYPSKFFSETINTSGATTTATSTEYTYAGNQLLATIDQPLTNGTATGTPIVSYIHPDNLGSTNVVSNSTGNVVQVLDYYPYGATRINNTTGGYNSQRKWIGQYSDSSGLNYLNARYEDPQRGQFLSEDPVFWGQQNLQDPQSFNAYSYAENNPIIKSDPSGMIAGWDDAIASGIGALVNFGAYAGVSFATGQPLTWGGTGNALVTGAIMGEGIDNAPETGGTSLEIALATVRTTASRGAIAGFSGNLTEQGINIAQGNQSSLNWSELGQGTAKGAITNVLLSSVSESCVPGLSCGRANWNSLGEGMSTKLGNGSISGVSMSTSFKAAVGNQASNLYGTFAGAVLNNFSGARSPGGAVVPSSNSIWTTPSGARVTFGGQLVSGPSNH